MPVACLDLRHLKQLVHQRPVLVVGIVKRLQFWPVQTGGHAWAARDVHHLVAVVLQQLEASARVKVQVVITSAGEITLVLKNALQRERPQRPV